ncbi:MAG: helix-turn-helix transcriptional regulator [candidate division Zixibacteria bacterium]
MKTLGTYLKKARLKAGLSLREVEEKADVSNAYISMIESGHRVDPHPKILRKLAKAYGLEMQEVMDHAGYLSMEADNKSEEDEVEEWYRRAIADPEFSFGRRSKDKIDYPAKKMVAMMYKRLKEKG